MCESPGAEGIYYTREDARTHRAREDVDVALDVEAAPPFALERDRKR